MKYLVVGLGNVGAQYENTRHNIGFVVLDALASSADVTFTSDRHAYVTKMKYRARTLVLVKPTTYMNLSGKAVKYWLTKEKIPIENLLVVVDDIALPLGTLRMRTRGGDGGHNGLHDIIYQLETESFPRLRIGIGEEFAKGHQVDFVLSQWTKKEEALMIPKVMLAVDAIKSFVTIGIGRTMNIINPKPQAPNPKQDPNSNIE